VKYRVVRPEILDSLPPDHPAAVANRRDLRRINRVMGTSSWIASTLARWVAPGDHILEVGAGDGELGRDMRRRLPLLKRCCYTGLDRAHTRPAQWPATWTWCRRDLLAHNFEPRPQVLLANFLLHQFTDAELARLGRAIGDIPVWIFCEPHRSRLALAGLAALRLFGLHEVSWHDGRVSVRAGFRGRELVELLGAEAAGRKTSVAIDWRGSYRLVSVAPIAMDPRK
jgi:hypothetical protein